MGMAKFRQHIFRRSETWAVPDRRPVIVAIAVEMMFGVGSGQLWLAFFLSAKELAVAAP